MQHACVNGYKSDLFIPLAGGGVFNSNLWSDVINSVVLCCSIFLSCFPKYLKIKIHEKQNKHFVWGPIDFHSLEKKLN